MVWSPPPAQKERPHRTAACNPLLGRQQTVSPLFLTRQVVRGEGTRIHNCRAAASPGWLQFLYNRGRWLGQSSKPRGREQCQDTFLPIQVLADLGETTCVIFRSGMASHEKLPFQFSPVLTNVKSTWSPFFQIQVCPGKGKVRERRWEEQHNALHTAVVPDCPHTNPGLLFHKQQRESILPHLINPPPSQTRSLMKTESLT